MRKVGRQSIKTFWIHMNIVIDWLIFLDETAPMPNIVVRAWLKCCRNAEKLRKHTEHLKY